MSKEESIRSVICGNLNRLLRQRKMTQKELSEYMGVSASTVNDWVRGKKIPRMDKVDKLCSIFGVSREEILYDHSSRTNPVATPAPPAPQKSSGLPELNARDERDIQKRLKSMLDDLDPNAGLAYYNGQEPMDDETRDLIRAALENSLRVAKQIAKAKYTPKKYRKTDDTAARIGKKILDASPSAQMAVSQIIDEDKGDDLTDKK